MEYRQLGRSGLRVSTLTMGTMTFGGQGGFGNVGTTDADGAGRQIDMCLDAGVNLIDTANKALATADAHGYQRFDQGLGVMVWSPLAGGLLSGKYRRGQQAADGRHLTEWSEPPVRDDDKLYDTIDVLVSIADDHGVSPAQVALAYLLTKPGVTTLVIGTPDRALHR